MEFPKDFEIQDPLDPVTARPVPRRRSPVSGSNFLGSWDVSSGMNGESVDSWGQSNWNQSSAAPALPHASQPTPACCRDGEMSTPSFTHQTPISYRTLLALSDPAITSNTTNVAPSMLAQITGCGSGSQIMPPASPSQDQLSQIAGRGSSSQMMPPSQIAHITGCGSSSQMIPPASPRQNQQAQTAGHGTNSCMMPPFPRLDQSAGRGSSSLMMPPASPRQDQLPQIAVCDSSSQMMPPASSRQNQCLSDGLPFPLPPNLNSAPETSMTNTIVMVPPATPANLGKKTKMQDLRFNKIIVDDTTSQNVQQNEFRTSQQTALEEALPSFSKPGVSPNIVYLQQQESEINVLPSAETQLQQAERENQGMDLNKTPEQKPRRKKHRPKVIREGKPAKTPKPVTPKPATPRRARKTESPSQGKRKYVWKKKKDPNSVHNPSDTVGESVNSQNGSASKPVRRSLNFDNEKCQARDDRAGSEMMFTPDEATQVAIASSNTKSDVHSVQGWGMGVSENPMGSSMSFDLNSSADHQFDNGYLSNTEGVKRATHIQDEYISMLKCVTLPPQPARKEGENLQKLARKNNGLNVACNHVIASEDGQNQIASDKIYDALLKGTKRGHSLVDDAQVLGDISHMQANIGMERASVIQKQTTENGQNEGISNSYSTFTCTPGDPKTIQAAQNMSEAVTFADAQRFMAYKKMRSLDHIFRFNQAEITSNNRPSQASSAPSHKAIVDCQRASTPVKPSGHVNAGCYQPSTPERPSEFTNNHDSMSIGPQARIEALIASNQLKLKAKGLKKKEQLQVNPMFFNAKRLENQTTFSTTESSCGQESLSTYSSQIVDRHISHLHVSFALDCQGDSSNYEGSVSRGSKLGTLIPYRDPVDEIIQKLSRLNINGGKMNAKDQEQNALVPYDGGVGTMVIFEGKKRRPRPKVDLDPESDRVWRVLMGKEADEEMGADKEKWWEEERRVFRGRAESFIARMHLVQGDRRFSKWKGSVVDSVIGVFLTQNVSDHLSSSAFMSLAARFPVRSSANNNATNVEKINRSIASDDSMSEQGKMSEQQSCDQSSVVIHEVEHVDGKEMENNHESPVSNTISSTLDYLESNNLNSHEGELRIGRESPDCGSATAVTVRSSTSGVDGEDRSSMEDAMSSQNSGTSHNFSKYHVEAAEQGKLNSQLKFDADDLLSEGMGNGFNSFTELLKLANSRGLQEMNGPSNGRTLSPDCCAGISQFRFMGIDQMTQLPNHAGPSIFKSNSHFQPIQSDPVSLTCAPSLSCYYQNSLSSTFVGLENTATAEDCNQSNASSAAASVDKTNGIKIMGRQCSPSAESSTKAMNHHNFLASRVPVDMYAPRSERSVLPITSLRSEIDVGMDSCCQSLKDKTQASNKTISGRLSISPENITMLQQRERGATSQVDSSQHEVKAQDQMGNVLTPQDFSSKHNHQEKTLEGVGAVKPDFKKEASISQKSLAEASKDALKAKKVKAESDRKKSFDWDSLRKQACCNGAKKERSSDAMDSLDYEALRNADVNVIAHAIRERGMNNLLAERIKDFLNRLVNDHGSIDLEWLRDVLPEKTKDYLLSIRGLGLKSVECVRLLTLHHLAFPVDTNVGRICVRLGWVPLQPLPESLQLHLLEMYPVLETIQKYLWPRLCKLDQRTLYELHYQLITFGKVFCTKSKPNCNACPMRGECKHFASAFASARLALPGPEEKSLVGSTIPSFPEGSLTPVFKSVPLPQLEGSTHTQDRISPKNCEPTIEEPASPEAECVEALESEIEDAFFDDPDEIPTIKLNMEEFTQNLQCYMRQNNIELQDGDMSKALVAITPEAASIPMAKLKNVSRLRTEHQVYELPDSHPLLEGLDRRERDDPSPYLLAIWTPGKKTFR
ncbi:transcriptional activator DEMETER-like [Iris pallida]|uniref:Transcriptional activator DEMETER-like n=1 Tax=Iris pallida TaxID=29817 RepID=A0AAX6IAD7_IRIPA|nr:transcriptional activator DEMETER-like [Iris pallida]